MEDEARCERVFHSKALLKGCLLGYRTLSMARKSVPTGLAAGIREGLFPDANAGRTNVKEENAGVKNLLRHKLGDARYHEIINSVVIVDKIHYCQRALTALPPYLNPLLLDSSDRNCGKNSDPEVRASQRAFISHDFLVLEVRFGSEALYIKAEKVYPATKVASIVIDLYDDFQMKASSVVLFSIQCRNKKMAMEELVFILASHTLKYDYASENCWDYAVKTAKRLLQACQALPGVSAEEGERLRKEEKYLEGRIAGSHCHNVLHAFKRMVHV